MGAGAGSPAYNAAVPLRQAAEFLADRPSHGAAQVIDDVLGLLASFEPAPDDDVALLAVSVL